MTLNEIRPIRNYSKFSDQRGEFQGIVNYGNWQEINIVHTHASCDRGGHFHRQTTEVIFMLKGKAEVQLSSCEDPNRHLLLNLEAGEGVQIPPMTIHYFRYTEQSIHIQLLDCKFNPDHQDLFPVEPDI